MANRGERDGERDQPRAQKAERRETNPRKELVREQLLDIAARMFDEKGYDRCSMAAIASEVGLGRSAIYHYFGSKDEILAALIDTEAFEPSKRLRDLASDRTHSPAERLRVAIVDGVVRRLSSGARFVRLARLEAQIPDHLLADYNRSRRAIYDYYVDCIEQGITAGEFREVDAQIAAFAVIGMANWTSRWYQPGGRLSAEEIGEAMADLALAGLLSNDQNQRRLEEARSRMRALSDDVAALTQLLG